MAKSDSLSGENSLTEITDLQPGDHLCCIYKTEEEHRNVLTPFIKEGLEANQKVIYIVDTNTAEEILDYLREVDFTPEPYLDSGQLVLLTGDESYLKGGTFDPDAMIDLLGEETKKALEQGYSALRVTGEMTWVLRDRPGSDRLMEYENKLNRFFPSHKALGMCQYDKNQFDADVLLGVLRTHPIAVIGDETYENFHYIKPGKLLGDNPKEAEFSSWEKGLKRAKSKKLRLEHFNSLLRSIRDVNQLTVSEKDIDALIEKVCDTLTETRGYNNVWIALFDETNQLLAAAESGLGEDFQPMLERLQDGDIPAKTRETLQTEGPIVTDDPFIECKDPPLAESYEGTTSITVRLERAGSVYGILVVSAPTEYTDTSDEKDLIKEVAGDIALALHSIETEKELLKSEERYRKYFEKTGDAIFVLKMGGKNHGDVLDVNAAATEQTGYSRDELIGMNMLEDLSKEPPPDFDLQEVDSKLSRGETVRFTEKKERKDGTEYWTEVVVTPLKHEGKQANLSIDRDITKRREAEQALKESEQRYRSLFNSIRDAILVADTDRRIINCNPAFTELFGYKLEEIEGKKTEYLYHDQEEYERMGEQIKESLNDPNFFYTIHYETKEGKVFPGETNVFYLRNDEGEVVGFIGLIRDISERKELQRRQDLFSSSLQQASLEVYWIRPDGNLAYTNEKVQEMLGYSEEELTEMYVWDVDPNPGHAKDKRKERWTELKEEGTLNFESVHKTKQGDTYPVEITSTYIQHGSKEYEFAFAKEITEREKAKEELRESEKKFRSYVENAPLGVFIVDENGNYLEVNEAACQLTGYTKEELLDMRITDIPPPEAVDIAMEEFEELSERGEMKVETPYLKKDGTKGVMVINAVKLSEDRYLGFTMDITERKEAKKELRQATLGTLKALNRTIEAKDEYTGEHIDRVQRLSVEVGREVGLPEEKLNQLRYASTLHDIGKIGVSDSILGKRGKLTEEEWSEMEKHPEIGERIVRQVDRLERAAKIIGQHQERYDGSGYPNGLEGEDITLEARILAVADAWDAMRSNRPYRDALLREEAIKELKENKGTQFDPEIVELVLEMIENDEGEVEFGEQ